MKKASYRVTIASTGLGHVARGIETWAADLARALARRGEAVTLCKGGGAVEAAYERVLPCWQRAAPKTERLLKWLPGGAWHVGLGSGYGIEQTTFALHLLGHLRREHVDLLHVQDSHLARLVQRACRLGWVRTRTILAHGTEETYEFLRRFTYLQHLAPAHLEEARTAGAWKPTWTAIPNFIDAELFRPGSAAALRTELDIPENARVILTVAAIKRSHKRVDYLIDEVARLRQKRPELVVWLVVAGGWEQETDEVISYGRERLGERVRFLVRFPRERMPDLYRMADLFVLGSLKEMMPIAVLEAMASGLPCLVNRHPVLEWMIGPGGAVLAMAEPGRLAGALEEWLDQPSRLTRLGERARQHCLANFARDPVVDRILEYYQLVLAHGRNRSARQRSNGKEGVLAT